MKGHMKDTGFGLAHELSEQADRIVAGLFDGSFLKNHEHWCVMAVGGYGRQELCPFSDLDLLFLIDRRISRIEIENGLKELLYPLWDAGFNASYSVRTIRQVIQDIQTDFFLRTSIIDARFVCGSDAVYKSFTKAVSSGRFLSGSRKFIADLIFHTRKRHEKFGDSVYFLEPHIKDGHGGLRDYQSILWAIKTRNTGEDPQSLVSASDLDELHRAAGFMLKTRYLLHKLTGRKTDQMYLEHQEALAEKMGYKAKQGSSPVEDFLKDFHTMALTVRSLIDSVLIFLDRPKGILSLIPARRERIGPFMISDGLIDYSPHLDAPENPLLILRIFQLMADRGLSLTPLARFKIKSSITKENSLHENREACRSFLGILLSSDPEIALTSMLETGVIEQLIPEFRTIRGKTIFDVYHIHTIDLHSIYTVSRLKELEKTEPEVFGRVRDREALFFGAFMHDIGKGYGRPHAALGAEVIRPICRRFGFDETRTELVVSLLKNHLVMADTASRRDLSEEKVINDLAQKTGDAQRLSMLYLLTMADTKATGPNAWNEWKASLMGELYTRTLNMLEKGLMKNRRHAMKLDEKWQALIGLSEENSHFSGRLWALPQAYVLSSELDDIRKHIDLSADISGPDDIRVLTLHRKNHTQLTIVTRDRPGLFSLLTGILAINRIEIISAKIFTWYDGTVVDTFKVLPPWHDYRDWNTIEGQFREFLAGKADVASRLRKTKALKTETPFPIQSQEEVVLGIDNDTSDFFTIIDVRAHKGIGLIHDISRTISDFDLDIHRAFLSLNSDLSSSVFYVVDSLGEKIIDEGRKKEILETIRESVLASRITASPEGEKRIYSKRKKVEDTREI